jgi:DNA-binding XRE family transcriptional regulator
MSGLKERLCALKGAALKDSEIIDNARRELGAKLAAYRRAAALSQAELASLVSYSRSTVANVETGRQHVPGDFWEKADLACHAGGALARANSDTEALVRQVRQKAARQASSSRLVLTDSSAVGTSGVLGPTSKGTGAAPVEDGSWLDAIARAASEARGYAQRAAVTDVGPGTVEQLTADVVRLSRAYVSAPPLPLFAAMHQGVSHVQAALDQKLYPAQARDLNFLAGALCGLMANASLDLGLEEAADDLARAAWTHGRIIDHTALMGWARGTQALAAIWDQRHLDAEQHAQDGLTSTPTGMGAVRLHAIRARALAALGDTAQARAAMKSAEKARANADHDELHDGIAGEFAFDQAKLRYYEALSLLDAEHPSEAGQAARAAISLYEAIPAPARSYGCVALARVQLARAQLMRDNLEDAADVLAEVLALDPQRRISSLNQHLDACRQLLRDPALRGSAVARELDQQLSAFTAASTARALPGGP